MIDGHLCWGEATALIRIAILSLKNKGAGTSNADAALDIRMECLEELLAEFNELTEVAKDG